MLKNRKMKAIGLLSIALGLGLNMQYAWNDYSFKESPLLVQVVMAETESGMCVGRGGSEMPKQVLIREDCTYYIQIGGDISISQSGGGGGVQWEKVQGNRCSCKNPLSGYSGKLGCNLTWETACKQY